MGHPHSKRAAHRAEFWPGETAPKMVEEERPAQAPALEDPEGFDTLSDDLVLRACLRAPFTTVAQERQ